MGENFDIFEELKREYRRVLPGRLTQFSAKQSICDMGRGGLGFILRYKEANPELSPAMKSALVQTMMLIANQLHIKIPPDIGVDFQQWCVWAEKNTKKP